ncbi:MAG: hypothetical protein Q4E28_04775 [Clostridia bacterium]|nr:hypothetical protein [Clostridia bacterium]
MENILIVGAKYDSAVAEFSNSLKNRGIKVTILTSIPINICIKNDFSDKVYIKAITTENIKNIILTEKIDTLFINFGNLKTMQTVFDLSVSGFLDEKKVKIAGLNINAMHNILKPEHFNIFLDANDLNSIENKYSSTLEYALEYANEIGYPVYVYPAFTPDIPKKTLCFNDTAIEKTFDVEISKSNLKQVFVEKSIDKYESYKLCFVTDIFGNSKCVLATRHLEPYGVGHKNSPLFVEDIDLSLREKMANMGEEILKKADISGFLTIYFAYKKDTDEIIATQVDPLFSKLYDLTKIYTNLNIEDIYFDLLNGKNLSEIDLNFASSDKLTAISNAYFIDDNGFNSCFAENYEASFSKNLKLLNKKAINEKIAMVSKKDTEELLLSLENNDDFRFFSLGELVNRGKDLKNLSFYTGIKSEDLTFISKLYNKIKKDNCDENILPLDFNFDDKTIVFINAADSRFTQSKENAYLAFFTALQYRKNGYKTVSFTSNFSGPATSKIAYDKVVHDNFNEKYSEILKKDTKIVSDFSGFAKSDINVIDYKIEFSKLLEKLNINHRPYKLVSDKNELLPKAQEIGYPISVKNDFFDIVCWTKDELEDFADNHNFSDDILVEKYFVGTCAEVYGVYSNEKFNLLSIVEKIERAGVNASDSTAVIPNLNLPEKAISKINEISANLLKELSTNKMVNMEFIYYDNDVFLLNMSTTNVKLLPFINLSLKTDIGKIYYDILENNEINIEKSDEKQVFVRMPIFKSDSFDEKRDSLVSKSIGQVVGVEKDFESALIQSVKASGLNVKDSGAVFFSLKDSEKQQGVSVAYKFYKQGFKVYATGKTAKTFNDNFVPANLINRISKDDLRLSEMIMKNKLDYLVILTDSNSSSYKDTVYLRRLAEKKQIPTFTSLEIAQAFIDSLSKGDTSAD